jgi:predicted HTH transcriptional regulator
MKRLVLRGKNSSFDSLSTNDEAMDYSFSKLRERYKCWTGESLDDKEMLSFGLIDSRGKLTNAGALLADKSPIRWSRLFCTHWSGLTKGGGIVDAVDDAEYSGSLITLLDEGMAFIKRNTKTMWKKLPDSRVEMPEYCERSYFEALVNALVHRDYLINGSEVHIDIFDDRMRIYSPGGMPDGSLIQNRIIDAVPSTRRNPVLADVFQRLGYMERKGSGLSRIIEGYQKAYNYSDDKKPEFESSRVEFTVTFKNLNYGENEDFDADGVETGKSGVEIIDNGVESGVETGKNGVESDVETDKNIIEMDAEEKIINLLKIEPKLSQKTISQRLNIPYRTLQRIMEKMVTTGKIRREGAARGGYWKVL